MNELGLGNQCEVLDAIERLEHSRTQCVGVYAHLCASSLLAKCIFIENPYLHLLYGRSIAHVLSHAAEWQRTCQYSTTTDHHRRQFRFHPC